MKLYFDEEKRFGIHPPDEEEWIEYETPLIKKINLKQDLNYKEVTDLKDIILKGDIWDDFPSQGYTLVGAEFKPGDEDQRVDILYLRDDGAVLPCELKIGGNSLDTHGQLIRYISDLYYQKIDLNYLKQHNNNYLSKLENKTIKKLLKSKFDDFISSNNISNKCLCLLPRTGLIIDEYFKPQIKKAIRYLNGHCGFNIKMIQINVYVDTNWEITLKKFKMRWDFIEIS